MNGHAKGGEDGRKAPRKPHRKKLTLLQIAEMFRDEDAAQDRIALQLWPERPNCPKRGSVNIQSVIKRKTMTHRCRDCTRGYCIVQQ